MQFDIKIFDIDTGIIEITYIDIKGRQLNYSIGIDDHGRVWGRFSRQTPKVQVCGPTNSTHETLRQAYCDLTQPEKHILKAADRDTVDSVALSFFYLSLRIALNYI